MSIGKLVAGFGLVALLGTCSVAPHLDREVYRAKVTDKERVVKGSEDEISSKYLVFTKLPNGRIRVFENTDSWIELKFNSSDVYGQIRVGRTYDLGTYGWRIPILSKYENILRVREVAQE
ncbi:DUF1523 family protein [Candidatus Woesearchaeota archaeon]|nr:DUF1523 family protein [Candidatus Woesearchaeota archaeon]